MPAAGAGGAAAGIISGEEWVAVRVAIASRSYSADPRTMTFGGACTGRCTGQCMHHRPEE